MWPLRRMPGSSGCLRPASPSAAGRARCHALPPGPQGSIGDPELGPGAMVGGAAVQHDRDREELARSILKRSATEAGLRESVTPHMIRHIVATLLLEESVDIRQILLGHRSIRTTELYTRLSSEAQRRLLRSKPPRRQFPLPE